MLSAGVAYVAIALIVIAGWSFLVFSRGINWFVSSKPRLAARVFGGIAIAILGVHITRNVTAYNEADSAAKWCAENMRFDKKPTSRVPMSGVTLRLADELFRSDTVAKQMEITRVLLDRYPTLEAIEWGSGRYSGGSTVAFFSKSNAAWLNGQSKTNPQQRLPKARFELGVVRVHDGSRTLQTLHHIRDVSYGERLAVFIQPEFQTKNNGSFSCNLRGDCPWASGGGSRTSSQSNRAYIPAQQHEMSLKVIDAVFE
jgi:hypothetical protein